MEKIRHNIKLDFADGGSQGEITVRANDAATQVLNVQLRTNGKAYKLADDVVATLHGTRRDGTVLYNACYIEDNSIRMELKNELLGVAGRVECVIKLVGTEPAALTTPGFDIYVEAVPDDAKIEAADTFGALVAQTAETKALQMKIEQKLADGDFDGEDGYSPEVTVTPIENGYRLDVQNKDTHYSADIIAPEKGEQGVGIASAVLNADYTLTLNFTDGSKYITPGIRGEKGEKGDTGAPGADGDDGVTPVFTIGTVTTLTAGSNATASIGGTAHNPVLNLGIPKGADGKDGEDAVGSGGTTDHAELINRDAEDQHPMGAITGLLDTLGGKQPVGDYLAKGDVPEWAMQEDKPGYTAEEVGALSAATEIPDALSDLMDDAEHRTVTDSQISAWNAKSDFSGAYADLTGKPAIPTVPTNVSAFTNDAGYLTDVPGEYVTETELTAKKYLTAVPSEYVTETELAGKGYITGYTETDPTVPAWAKAASKPAYTASEVGAHPDSWMPTPEQVGADPAGTATAAVASHNANTAAHDDIRLLITNLTTRLNALANSEDVDLDQMAELVAYIKDNRELIEQITTAKISYTDIVNDLTTNVGDKPLSAAQGVALKALIDAITVPTKLSDLADDSTHRTVTDTEKSTWNAKSDFSGAYGDLTGKPTIPTVPANVSAFTNDAGYLTAVPSEYVTETELTAKGYITGYTETDPTVPSWAKAETKPSYTKTEVGLGNVDNVKQYSASNPPPYPVTSVNGMIGAVTLNDLGVVSYNDPQSLSSGQKAIALENIGAVPTTRTVNGKALSANITLSASDVGAVPTSSSLTVTGIDADGTTHTWTMYGVSV